MKLTYHLAFNFEPKIIVLYESVSKKNSLAKAKQQSLMNYLTKLYDMFKEADQASCYLTGHTLLHQLLNLHIRNIETIFS